MTIPNHSTRIIYDHAMIAQRDPRGIPVTIVFEVHELRQRQVFVQMVEHAKSPDPPTIKLTFNVTFNAEGQQIMRGVVEDRETMREGVSSCAMKRIPALNVPPQGASVAIEIPWTLP